MVEDDPDYALLVEDALQDRARFAVTVAATAREARERGYEHLGAVVLDHNLPDATGLDLLPEIVGACEVPVIMLTGENVVETAVQSIRAGAFSYLVKTAENLDVLPEIVGQAVEEARRRRERREMQAQMRRAENLASLGTLAAGMCHEMNNPLAGVVGYADMYLRGFETNARDCMEAILASAYRLRDVVKSLASFAGGSKAPREKVDIVGLIGEEINKRRQALSDASIMVVFNPPAEPLEIVGNRPGLGLAIHHIVRNARQAMEKSSEKALTVCVEASAGSMRIEVRDTGPGVPEDIRDRVFDPFFTTRDPDKGMGMGLAISHRIVEDHGGRLWHESGRDGGALFVLEIPEDANGAHGSEVTHGEQGDEDA